MHASAVRRRRPEEKRSGSDASSHTASVDRDGTARTGSGSALRYSRGAGCGRARLDRPPLRLPGAAGTPGPEGGTAGWGVGTAPALRGDIESDLPGPLRLRHLLPW
jgi:hypothetical protein